jgi:hypothetical protein
MCLLPTAQSDQNDGATAVYKIVYGLIEHPVCMDRVLKQSICLLISVHAQNIDKFELCDLSIAKQTVSSVGTSNSTANLFINRLNQGPGPQITRQLQLFF